MRLVLVLLIVAVFSVSADPIDTAYDLLDAVQWQDGYALEGLLTQDLYATLSSFLTQVRELVGTDPALAGTLLEQRYSGSVTIDDFNYMNNEELLGRLMGEISLQPIDYILNESAQMEGRNAAVTLTYINGETVTFNMVWENSGWRVSDSSLLYNLFR